jgi:deoxyribodipyrimidine photo-lyase
MQTERFDKAHKYIKKWVPEFESPSYPEPMVEHTIARDRALKVYGEALKSNYQ